MSGAASLPPHDLLPRSLRDKAAAARRRALLGSRPAHMAALIDLAGELRRRRPGWEVPDLDPASSGTQARALFLLEKPGPQTIRAIDDGAGGEARVTADACTALAAAPTPARRSGRLRRAG